ncbi:MAG TPA: hypothetical protein VFJ85_02765 [Acidimicrobiales bacterium]|nr:hypothetical protein [Acidimicrobiales bacterium]
MTTCACVTRHSPGVLVPHQHHVVPLSWVAAGAEPLDPPTVDLCPSSHDAVHALLNEFVRHDGVPPWEDHRCLDGEQRPGRARYNPLVRRLAALAWDQRAGGRKMPYTLTHSGPGATAPR